MAHPPPDVLLPEATMVMHLIVLSNGRVLLAPDKDLSQDIVESIMKGFEHTASGEVWVLAQPVELIDLRQKD